MKFFLVAAGFPVLLVLLLSNAVYASAKSKYRRGQIRRQEFHRGIITAIAMWSVLFLILGAIMAGIEGQIRPIWGALIVIVVFSISSFFWLTRRQIND